MGLSTPDVATVFGSFAIAQVLVDSVEQLNVV
jgi:hypothetical protein